MVRVIVLVTLICAPLFAQAIAPAPAPRVHPLPRPRSRFRFAPLRRGPRPKTFISRRTSSCSLKNSTRATPLLNRAYNETPANRRSRPLILNRANLDLVQKVNPLRGVKDVYEYFIARVGAR
jgi:hypothetical protein